jgi:hypothetical protein
MSTTQQYYQVCIDGPLPQHMLSSAFFNGASSFFYTRQTSDVLSAPPTKPNKDGNRMEYKISAEKGTILGRVLENFMDQQGVFIDEWTFTSKQGLASRTVQDTIYLSMDKNDVLTENLVKFVRHNNVDHVLWTTMSDSNEWMCHCIQRYCLETGILEEKHWMFSIEFDFLKIEKYFCSSRMTTRFYTELNKSLPCITISVSIVSRDECCGTVITCPVYLAEEMRVLAPRWESFCMIFHKRLGRDSVSIELSVDVVEHICRLSL